MRLGTCTLARTLGAQMLVAFESPTAPVASGSADHRRHNRVRWTDEEIHCLRQGVIRHGAGHWREIIGDREFELLRLSGRTAVDLKDKWRNLHKSRTEPNTYSRPRTDKVPRSEFEALQRECAALKQMVAQLSAQLPAPAKLASLTAPVVSEHSVPSASDYSPPSAPSAPPLSTTHVPAPLEPASPKRQRLNNGLAPLLVD